MVERRNPALRKSVLLSCLLWTFSLPCIAQGKPDENVSPVWSTHILDWEKPSSARGVFSAYFFSPSAVEGHSPGLVFLDNGHLVIHEIKATGQLSTRDEASAFVLHMLMVDELQERFF